MQKRSSLRKSGNRRDCDHPSVVPEGSVNFASIGNFAETPRDTVFTTEYSIRTAMEAVYTLLNVDRGVPEVWGSVYDIRDLLNATVALRDGKKITDLQLGFIQDIVLKAANSRGNYVLDLNCLRIPHVRFYHCAYRIFPLVKLKKIEYNIIIHFETNRNCRSNCLT